MRNNSRCAPVEQLDQSGAAGAPGVKRKQGVVARAENYVAKRVLTSELGKKLLREFLLPGVMTVLDAVQV